MNSIRKIFYWFLLLLISSLFNGCSNSDLSDSAMKLEPLDSANAFKLKDYLCTITPSDCHSKLMQKVYLAPPDAIYERKVGNKPLRIPMAYLSFVELLQDPRYEKNESMLVLESTLPDLDPRTPENMREYFIPYDTSRISIYVGHRNREPGIAEWIKNLEESRSINFTWFKDAVRRPDKYGLEIWGEDFTIWPNRIPCTNLGKNEPPCTPAYPKDVLSPLASRTSLMVCDPETLADRDAAVMQMSTVDREAYFASKQWSGRRRAMCSHDIYYEPLNASVWLIYPRRFISQWQQTEERIRKLLDSFLVS